MTTFTAPATTPEEIEAIILAEFAYWREAPDNIAMNAMGAMSATANILCAIHGHRAPWHPKAAPDFTAAALHSEANAEATINKTPTPRPPLPGLTAEEMQSLREVPRIQ